MSSLQDTLNRAGAWIERENARSDAKLKTRPDWWHAGKIAFGLACICRAGALVIHAASIASYALAVLFLSGGLYLILEGKAMLRQRRSGARNSAQTPVT